MINLGLYNCCVSLEDPKDTELIVLARNPKHAEEKARDYIVYHMFRSSTQAGNCSIKVYEINSVLKKCGVFHV